ncbi:MAG: site-specific DNA-methyltransferase [Candidatus Dormibacteraeota bacterium]|uniref:Methyltransferase n=1 Tax=Candidatus Dormiibacter inghamiae TaxID=3127013 RepID=A0A934KC41_9BACT|nr:site-specific DNA-methyltransferase [Candidatus Dormibacteraeota bacterium]MBJ7606903.1 site-specific DNA-methyltransferase [Candidatus Dormibacteraeota bacterium]
MTGKVTAARVYATDSDQAEVARVHQGYRLADGTMLVGTYEQFLTSQFRRRYAGKIQLILTSPPFPLNRKKRYGNKNGDEYLQWLGALGKTFHELLAPRGSVVLELGNAWERGKPTMSTLPLRALLAVLDGGKLHLCQQFVCNNPARLPSPVQWVNKERIRVKDTFTHIWWMSPGERPYANNRTVLTPYGKRMRTLLSTGQYNSGIRPSGYNIGSSSFLSDNGGAIPGNVLTVPNTQSTDAYRKYCIANHLPVHPARMQPALARFFIDLLTRPGDIVLDPFAGSNTTGAEAHLRGRRWLSIEPTVEYVAGSKGRFKRYNRNAEG